VLEPRGLSEAQATLLHHWAPDLQVLADWSWGLTDTVVLHARAGGRDVVVKAAGTRNHHIGREIAAHRQWVAALAGRGRAPRLLWCDEAANLLVTEHLDGELVLGTRAEGDPSTYAQAGELLAVLHGQGARVDEDYERRQNARALQWLDGPHRIDPATEAELRARVFDFPCHPTVLVPTHGDWQPRNWLRNGGEVRVIDFGRAEWRPAHTDFARLPRSSSEGGRTSRRPSSTATGRTLGSRTPGAAACCAKRWARRAGRTRWGTSPSRRRGTRWSQMSFGCGDFERG